jgi:hypothetical protein
VTIVSWTVLVFVLIALGVTVANGLGKLPLWPAVLLLIVVELVGGRVKLP